MRIRNSNYTNNKRSFPFLQHRKLFYKATQLSIGFCFLHGLQDYTVDFRGNKNKHLPVLFVYAPVLLFLDQLSRNLNPEVLEKRCPLSLAKHVFSLEFSGM